MLTVMVYGDLDDGWEDAGIGTEMSVGERTEVHLPDNARLVQLIIPLSGNLGMSYYGARRRGSGARNARSRAREVRKHTRGALRKVICLQYDLPDILARHALARVV